MPASKSMIYLRAARVLLCPQAQYGLTWPSTSRRYARVFSSLSSTVNNEAPEHPPPSLEAANYSSARRRRNEKLSRGGFGSARYDAHSSR